MTTTTYFRAKSGVRPAGRSNCTGRFIGSLSEHDTAVTHAAAATMHARSLVFIVCHFFVLIANFQHLLNQNSRLKLIIHYADAQK